MTVSTTRLKRTARGLALLALAMAWEAGCALGLDFDSLDNTCEPPAFDLPTSNTYCTGSWRESPPVPLTGIDGSIVTLGAAADARGDLVAVGVLGVDADATCLVVSVGVIVGRVDEEGRFAVAGSFQTRDIDVVFRTGEPGSSRPDCEEGNRDILPVDVEILDLDPLVVAVSSVEGGLLLVEFDPRGDPIRAVQFPSLALTHPVRECSLGACVSALGQACSSHRDCAGDSYCTGDGLNKRCEPLPDCGTARSCPPGTLCGTLGRCVLECGQSFDCPHPLVCLTAEFPELGIDRSVCRRTRCGVTGDLQCLDSVGTVCHSNLCFDECGGDEQCPPEAPLCRSLGTDSGIDACVPHVALGPCQSGQDCYLGLPLGVALDPEPRSDDGSRLLYVSSADSVRIIRLGADGPVELLPVGIPLDLLSDDTSAEDYVTDVAYDAESDALLVSVAQTGVWRIPGPVIRAAIDGGSELNTTGVELVADSGRGRPITRIDLREGLLVILDGGLAAGTALRARLLDRASMEPAIDVEFGVGDILSLGPVPDHPNLWLAAIGRGNNVDFELLDVSRKDIPVVLSLPPHLPGLDNDSLWPTVVEGAAPLTIVSGAEGVTLGWLDL